MSKKVSLALSIFLLIPLLMTGYSLKAERYPCISSIGECFLSFKKESKTCDCMAVVKNGILKSNTTISHEFKKLDKGDSCTLKNIDFSAYSSPYPQCSK